MSTLRQGSSPRTVRDMLHSKKLLAAAATLLVVPTMIYVGSSAEASEYSASSIQSFGLNDGGQLGDGTSTNRSTPATVDTSGVLSGKTITGLSAGSYHSCAVADGQAYCWGRGFVGQLGDGSTSDSPSPISVNTSGVLSGKTVTSVAAGDGHTCVIADGSAYCWGDNSVGQLGDGTTTASPLPVSVDTSGVLSGKTITSIAAGFNHTCAVADGSAYCWGANFAGQLGVPAPPSSTGTPVAVDTSGVLSGKTITSIAAGQSASYAIADGKAYRWGFRNEPYDESMWQPTPLPDSPINGQTVTSVSAGGFHACALSSGQVYCWGRNDHGQLGDGTTTNRNTPGPVNTSGVLAGKTVTSIAAGLNHSCALADGTAYCWGNNTIPQISPSAASPQLTPFQVNTSQPLVAVSAGAQHTLVASP